MGGTGEGNGLFKDSTGLMDSNHISIKMFICIKKTKWVKHASGFETKAVAPSDNTLL